MMRSTSYTLRLSPEEDGAFLAEIRELPGCFASGGSVREVLAALGPAMEMCGVGVPE